MATWMTFLWIYAPRFLTVVALWGCRGQMTSERCSLYIYGSLGLSSLEAYGFLKITVKITFSKLIRMLKDFGPTVTEYYIIPEAFCHKKH